MSKSPKRKPLARKRRPTKTAKPKARRSRSRMEVFEPCATGVCRTINGKRVVVPYIPKFLYYAPAAKPQ